MGLNIKGFARNIIKPLETGFRVGGGIQNELLRNGFRTANLLQNPARSLNDVFASRTGLSTALNVLNLRLPQNKPSSDKPFDGLFVGTNGQTFPANTPLSNVPAVIPTGGVRNNETIIYVNGIRNNVDRQANSLQAIADQTGSRVVGIHNATEGGITDVLQSLSDKLDIGRNPAVDTLADTVYNELRAGREVHLVAHSQGAIITSRALEDVKNRLMLEDGMSRRNAERLMGNIKVETFASVSRRFTDGPQYVHYVNRNDSVPQIFGLRSWLNPFAHAGRGAVTHYFRDGKRFVSHGFEEFYLPQRVPFEQARQGRFN